MASPEIEATRIARRKRLAAEAAARREMWQSYLTDLGIAGNEASKFRVAGSEASPYRQATALNTLNAAQAADLRRGRMNPPPAVPFWETPEFIQKNKEDARVFMENLFVGINERERAARNAKEYADSIYNSPQMQTQHLRHQERERGTEALAAQAKQAELEEIRALQAQRDGIHALQEHFPDQYGYLSDWTPQEGDASEIVSERADQLIAAHKVDPMGMNPAAPITSGMTRWYPRVPRTLSGTGLLSTRAQDEVISPLFANEARKLSPRQVEAFFGGPYDDVLPLQKWPEDARDAKWVDQGTDTSPPVQFPTTEAEMLASKANTARLNSPDGGGLWSGQATGQPSPEVVTTETTPRTDTALSTVDGSGDQQIADNTETVLKSIQQRKKVLKAMSRLWGIPDRSEQYEATAIGKYTAFMNQRAAQMALSSPLSSKNQFLLDFLRAGGSIDKAISLSGALEFGDPGADFETSILTSPNITAPGKALYLKSGDLASLTKEHFVDAKYKRHRTVFTGADTKKHRGSEGWDGQNYVYYDDKGNVAPDDWIPESSGARNVFNLGQGEKMTEAMQIQLARGAIRNLLGVKEYFFDNDGNLKANRIDILNAQLGTPGSDGRRVRQMMVNAIADALRMETGAAITKDEMEQKYGRIFPTIGDSANDIRHKLVDFEMTLRDLIELNNPQWASKQLPAPRWDPVVITLSDDDLEGEKQLKKLVPGSYYVVNGQLGRKPPDMARKWGFK